MPNRGKRTYNCLRVNPSRRAHWFGSQPVDLDAVLAVGKRVGTFGHAAAFSFHPSKHPGAHDFLSTCLATAHNGAAATLFHDR